MQLLLDRFYGFLNQPLYAPTRLVLAALVVPLLLSFMYPLWRIDMEAPQYPNGLSLEIYSYKIDGGDGGRHIQEINTLNHYIGMRTLDREAMTDLDWIPFALGGLAVVALRVAAIGNVMALVDLAVATTYISLFAFARYVYTLYVFGHNLNPQAPVKVPGFMPGVIGSKKIANFTTYSWPSAGSVLIGVFVLGVFAILAWHLVRGRRAAVKAASSTV